MDTTLTGGHADKQPAGPRHGPTCEGRMARRIADARHLFAAAVLVLAAGLMLVVVAVLLAVLVIYYRRAV